MKHYDCKRNEAVSLLAACNSSPQRKVALGTLERDRITHSAAVSEMIVEQPVPQGSMVKQGAGESKAEEELAQAAQRSARGRGLVSYS